MGIRSNASRGALAAALAASLACLAGCSYNHRPTAPSVPSGTTSGWADSVYSYSATARDFDYDSLSIRFAWGGGDTSDWSSDVCSGDTVRVIHSWPAAGSYSVMAQARDARGATSSWSGTLAVSLGFSPSTPSTPSGSDSGQVCISCHFASSAVDRDGDSVAIRFDWGNGDTSGWSGSARSGAQVVDSYAFVDPGIYNIRSQARDISGATSTWSDAHQVIISLGSGRFPNRVVATVMVDDGPCGVAALPSGENVYVTNSWRWSSDVSVIRTSDNKVVATIPAGDGPTGVTALPNGGSVYVASEYSDNVFVIRTSDNTVSDTVPLGSSRHPVGIVALPDGNQIYVANHWGRSVSVIRTSSNTVTATVPVGAGPYGITSLPDGSYVYATDCDSDKVTVIRTSDNAVTATVNVGAGPMGVASLPNGSYVYVANYGSDNVSVIRTSDNTVAATIPSIDNAYGVVSLPNGNYVYVTGLLSVSVIRTSDNAVVATIPVGTGGAGIAVLPDGSRVYVANFQSDNVSVIGF